MITTNSNSTTNSSLPHNLRKWDVMTHYVYGTEDTPYLYLPQEFLCFVNKEYCKKKKLKLPYSPDNLPPPMSENNCANS